MDILTLSANEKKVLKEIFNNRLISRTEIAKITNTNKATISGVLNNLKKKQIVNEVGEGNSSKSGGRRPILLEIKKEYGYTISIDFTYDSIDIMYNYFSGQIMEHNSIKLSNKTMKSALFLLKEVIDSDDNKDTINGLLGIAISVHGIVNEHQYVQELPFLELNEISIKDSMKSIADVPVVIENEANLAAMYEHSIHNNHSNKSLATLSIHKGIGAGLIFNNKLYRGYDGKAGEIGKTLVSIQEGNSVKLEKIENLYSQDALIERIENKIGRKISLAEINQRYHQNDPLIVEELNFFIKHISILNYNLYMQINPETIYINCPIINEIPELLDTIKDNLNNFSSYDIDIRLTSNVAYATLFGASLAITQKLLHIENIQLQFK